MNTAADILKWVGYIICVCAIGAYVFIVAMPCVSCGTWDYVVLPIAVLVIPIASLIVASKWPLIAGEVLIAVALFIGWDIIPTNFWAASLYSLPFLVAGLAFLISGIFTFLKQRGAL